MNPTDPHSRPGEYRVPDQARTAQCQSCAALIVWTRTSKNGRPIPLSMATVRTDEYGARWALTHFADCPLADQHRKPAGPPQVDTGAAPHVLDLRDLPDYLDRHHLVATVSTVTDLGDGRLHIELSTRRIA
jgi:hypothetical protein